MDKPKFKARTSSRDKIACPWCEHEEYIWDNPSDFLPNDNEDYEDEPKKCRKCKKTYFLSVETSVSYTFTSRFAEWCSDEWENYDD